MGVLLLRQTASILSTYAADVSGVCSALYEMGGMTVMHDASGCNSTYNTHDEPRWYDMPSMVYISALSETEAMLGDESKIIDDISEAALELKPRFIAIAGTPIPMMMGTDFTGMAKDIEQRTGIPALGFATNGMHSYLLGAGAAFKSVAERFCHRSVKARPLSKSPVINLLGATPLDFSVTGGIQAIKKFFEDEGFTVQSTWAMNSSWEEMTTAGAAHVNIVLSACALPLAEVLKSIYGTPYVAGLPYGRGFSSALAEKVRKAASCCYEEISAPLSSCNCKKPIYIIGEAVASSSIKNALQYDYGIKNVHVISALENGSFALDKSDFELSEEDDIFKILAGGGTVIADPLYKPAAERGGAKFIALPHEGYSGRIFRSDIPILAGDSFNKWIEGKLEL